MLNASKSVLGETSVKFLGHVVTVEGISPILGKVAAITNFPKPETVKERLRFLAICNFYRRFIPHAVRTQVVLNSYLKGTKKSDRTPILRSVDSAAAFEKCKNDLAEATVLYHTSADASLAIVMDASDTAVDHKPLVYAFKQKEDKCTQQQLRHLDLIGQFKIDIRYLKGSENVEADALSRIHISTINTPSVVESKEMAREQLKDSQLQDILAGSCPTSLVLQPLPVGQPPVTLHCDVSMDRIRPFVPEMFRREIFNNLHALSHPGIRASLKMVAERYVWPSMRQDAVLWARTCLQCQRAKVSRHTRSEIGKFELPSSRFEHVHIDLEGPLPPSEGFRYYLTCVDRFSKFGPPLRLTTDQGTQFEASLFDALSKFLGIERRHTTPYHPVGNGQVGKFHRQLKAAIMAHGNTQRTTVLLTILTGFGATWKEELQATTAEMIYGAPIRLPSEFLCPSKPSPDSVTLEKGSGSQCSVSHPPTTQHQITKNLRPYKVVSRTEKVFRILRHGKEVSVSIDRLKPAYIPKELEDIPVEVNVKKKVSFQIGEVPESGQEKPKESFSRQETTTRSGRRVRFNPKYILLF
ncbi:transposon Ty3-I Gag-Pol polyprotein [Nephila pilipes]|uniref:RNA-directed DNA polymerase n=1 Tax=Nephila pilipes TaxID=299642 RepID=A0A8X6TCQ7_NEPPI|nr:transposon Ty3-I Gag-Pol polyprotein [Nephila pilipes]